MGDKPLTSQDLSVPKSQEGGLRGRAAAVKRAMDIVGAVIGLPLSLPLMAVAAVVIKLDSPGPILFEQMRAGQHGKVFKIYKLRTMVANAEELLEDLIDLDELEEPMFKLKDDPRVTRVGGFLRRWSIDELPQLYNVLKGEMSLVGPRPEEARLVERYSQWHRLRLQAKPGITGPVQINGRGDLPLEMRVQLEVEYIDNYSVWKDLVILLKTVPVVVLGNGSY
jgi:exopolysaccharide biosynthesis polyprenyl glycosylphosphotransferase